MTDILMQVLSDSYLLVIPLVIAYLVYRKDRNVYPLLLSILLTLLIVTALKVAIVEPRPCASLGALECADPMQSFPSRHAALVFAALVFLWPRRPMFTAYAGYAFLIGLSRVSLGEHYPHDVLAGALIGLAIGYICLKTAKRIGIQKRVW